MLIRNTAINFIWELKNTPSFATYNEAYFDLQITAPDGTVTYLEGSTSWSNIFTQPTLETEGQIEYTYTPTQEGVYTMILGTGNSDNFNIINTRYLLVVDSDTESTDYISLP